MKDYHLIPLEDREAKALLDLTKQCNDTPLNPIPYPGDYTKARNDYHPHAFWYKNGQVIGLILSENIREIPVSFGDLTHLEFLIIDECTINSKFPESIKKLENLQRIIAYSEVSQVNKEDLIIIKLDFPDVLDQLKSLKKFVAEGAVKLFLPPSIENNKCLEEIHFYAVSINSDHRPIELGCIQALKKLDIEYVNPKMFDLPSLVKLKTLKELKINHIYEYKDKLIPMDFLFEIPSLEKLNLGYCKLSHIPETINILKNLTELSLHWNDLQEIPESIGDLKNLKKLNLHSNIIKKLPFSIGNCINMEELILSVNNYIDNFEEWSRCLLTLPKLKRLSISKRYYNLLPSELTEKSDLDIEARF